MPTEEEATKLSIFISEGDHYRGRPVDEAILELAREHGLAGAIVFKGWAGFGASGDPALAGRKRSARRTLLIELLDKPGIVEAFLAAAAETLRWSLVTRERVAMTRYGPKRPNSR